MHHKSSDRQGINPLILVTILVATPAHSTSIQQFQGVSRRSPAVRAQNPPNKLEVGLRPSSVLRDLLEREFPETSGQFQLPL
jgi:hypothetical protein